MILPDRHRVAVVLVVIVAVGLSGCGLWADEVDLGRIYNRSAQYEGVDRNPVIVIPGILGSRLRDGAAGGRIVWGTFGGDSADPGSGEGARSIALPMEEGRPLRELRDGVVVDGVLDRLQVRVLGIPISLNAYRTLLGVLGAGGYMDSDIAQEVGVDYGEETFTCFQFPYDWRRDLAENAARLEEFIREKREVVRREMERRFGPVDREIRFDIVAHSMGGLLARYFLRYGGADLEDGPPPLTWAGAEFVGKVIFVGTPNAGSLDALTDVVNGLSLSIVTPTYPPAILGTFPSVYQLLPRVRHGAVRIGDAEGGEPVDLYDVATWERFGWGLADPEQAELLQRLLRHVDGPDARRRIALDHLRKCLDRARRFHEAIDVPAVPPSSVSLVVFVGDAEPTPEVAVIDPDTGRPCVVRQGPGDGAVLRASALMDERQDGRWQPTLRSPIRWSQVVFLRGNHLGLTQDPTFTNNVLYHLLEAPPP